MSPLIFRPRHNTLARISLVVLAAGAGGTVTGLMLWARTPYARAMETPVEQPLEFDHRHHTRDEGIDCRYCHNTVDKAPFASIPPTQLCLNCHSQVWNKSPLLEPVRAAGIHGLAVLPGGRRRPFGITGPLLGPDSWRGKVIRTHSSLLAAAALRGRPSGSCWDYMRAKRDIFST